MVSVKPVVTCDAVFDDRCTDPPLEPPFLPGISLRQSPSCTGDVCGLLSCNGGNWRVSGASGGGGTLDRSEWIKGWIITQLFTRGLVDCNEHPQNKRDGGWWADSYRTASGQTFSSGSKLWALSYAHGGATNELLVRAKDYASLALAQIKRLGIVQTLTVDAEWVTRGVAYPGSVMHLIISVTGPGLSAGFTVTGQQMPNAEWLWAEYRPKAQNRTIGRQYARA